MFIFINLKSYLKKKGNLSCFLETYNHTFRLYCTYTIYLVCTHKNKICKYICAKITQNM